MTFPHLATCSSGLLTSLASGEWERATYGDRKWLAADGGRGACHVKRRTDSMLVERARLHRGESGREARLTRDT